MMLSDITWVQWVEHFLSFAGLAAILTFGVRWITKITSHTKEMEQLDKVVRDTLREALDGVNQARKIDKELFDKQLEKLNVELQGKLKESKFKDKQIVLYEKLSNLISRCCILSTNVFEKKLEKLAEVTQKEVSSEIRKIIDSSSLAPEEFEAILKDAKESGETPQERDVRTVLFLTYLMHVLGKFYGMAEVCVYAMPIILEEFLADPNRDLLEIWAVLPERLESGDFPSNSSNKLFHPTDSIGGGV